MRKGGNRFLWATGLLSGVALGAMATNQLVAYGSSQAILAHMAAIEGASVETVTSDLWRGQARLGNLRLSANGVTLTAGSVRLPVGVKTLDLITPAMALDGAASADDLIIDTGTIVYKIKHLEASGTSLGGAELAALFDPKSTISAVDRMKSLNAAAISAPEVTASIKIGKVNEGIVYRDVKLADIVSGKISAASIAETEVTMTQADKPNVSVIVANTIAKNMDLTLIARILTQSRTDAKEPLQTIYESFSADAITVKGIPNATVSFGKISGQNFKARPLATPYMAAMQQFGSEFGKDTPPSDEAAKGFARIYADIMRSLEIGSVELLDLNVAAQDKGKPVAFKLGRIAMTGLAGGKLGEIAYEGIDLSSAEAKVRLASFGMRGFDFRPMLAMADAVADKGKAALSDPTAIRSYVPTLDHIGMRGLMVDAAAQGGKGGNTDNGKRNILQLAGMNYDAGGFLAGIPTNATLSADHLTMDLTGLLKQPDMKEFAELGYNSVDFSSKVDLGWNEAAKELALKSWSMDAAGMGNAKLAATLGNVSKDLFSANSSEQLAAGVAAVIKKVEFNFVNNGIVDKALEVQAKKSKSSVDDVRKMMIAGTAAILPGVLGNSQGAKDIGNAVAKFLANPKTLNISASSAEGLGIADYGLLDNPLELMKRLQIKATAN